MENTPTLPSKCCARCGFLYGLAANPARIEDAIFDPDRIRDVKFPPSWGEKPGLITTLPYVIQEYRETIDDNSLRVKTEPEPIEIRELGWVDTVAICCYKKLFPKLYVEREPYQGLEIDYRNYVALAFPKNREVILSEIRKERQECSGFIDYHPGYNPSQHIQLELDEMRIRREEDHERRLSEWIKYQDEKWERYKIAVAIAAVLVSIITVGVAFAVAIIQPLVAYFLPLIFGG